MERYPGRDGVALLGVRHHGPGSARAVIAALDEIQPTAVLVEMPADAQGILPYLTRTETRMPVAGLVHPEDDPSATVFLPFADHSPETCAIRWAASNDVPVTFIDLPVGWIWDDADQDEPESSIADPLGTLAMAAGYEDGEGWWNDVVEESSHGDPAGVFSAIAHAMEALRENVPVHGREARREAHMRMMMREASKTNTGAIAIVCGAFHVPALATIPSAAADKSILAGASKRKTAATLAPWTMSGLAAISGYGAGVTSPAWYAHLFENAGRPDMTVRWLARMATTMRDKGRQIPTASLIETVRTAETLASIRGRPAAGLSEIRDACVSILFGGDLTAWRFVETALLIGEGVGEIPDDVPLAPILADLQARQKRLRLKPESAPKRLSLDLREENGLARSQLLHALRILGVNWGVPDRADVGRGTFKEAWTLEWKPEFAAALVGSIVRGTTVPGAAASLVASKLEGSPRLADIVSVVSDVREAGLHEVWAAVITALETASAASARAGEILPALAPLGEAIRYGDARARGNEQERLAAVFEQLAIDAATVLLVDAGNLDAQESAAYAKAMEAADSAVVLLESKGRTAEIWEDALRELARSVDADARCRGKAMSICYARGLVDRDETMHSLSFSLSPVVPPEEAAAWFEGFLGGGAKRLVVDAKLRDGIDKWICGLDEDVFVAHLPTMRRVLSALAAPEKRRIETALFDAGSAIARTASVSESVTDPRWSRHLAALSALFSQEIRR